MDVKVSVSGQHNERIRLQYVLFNDVWLHQFQKGSLISEMHSEGFKGAELSDGYDWRYRITLNE